MDWLIIIACWLGFAVFNVLRRGAAAERQDWSESHRLLANQRRTS